MEVYFGTVVRSAPIRAAGELVRLDWARRSVLERRPIFPVRPLVPDVESPRGQGRGSRGVAVRRRRVVNAGYHTLSVFDRQLRRQRDLSHPLLAGLHEIDLHRPDRAWVAATAVNAALEVDLETGELLRQFWPSEMPRLAAELGIPPLSIDKRRDYRAGPDPRYGDRLRESHVHLNAVRVWDDQAFALFSSCRVIANLTTGTVAVRDPGLSLPHNLLMTEDGTAIVCNSLGRSLCFYDLATGTKRGEIDLMRYAWVRRLERRAVAAARSDGRAAPTTNSSVAAPIFVRGLASTPDHLYVGISPASILRIDRGSHDLVDAFNFSLDVHVCVHGLDVADPPARPPARRSASIGRRMSEPYTRFMILSSPRSGTHMLRTALAAHPAVVSLAEMFNPDWTEGAPFDADTPAPTILSEHVFRQYPSCVRAVGFALHRSQARFGNWPDLWDLLEADEDLRVISLCRHDMLRRYLSWRIMREPKTEPPEPKVMTREELEREFLRCEQELHDFDRRFECHPLLQLSYEELCSDWERVIERVQTFLGVPVRRLRPGTRPNPMRRLSTAIAGFDDLAAEFASTRWAHLFRPTPSFSARSAVELPGGLSR